ncbi:MAG: (Fe-S)-binding protein [Kofleriaceae bacterium]
MSDARDPRDPAATFAAAGVERQLDNCTYCPKMCRHACPVAGASGHEPWTPQAKMGQLAQLRRGRAAWTPAQADPLWACTGCRQCTTYCEHDNEPGLVLFTGRAQAVARGAGHPELRGYGERFRRRDVRLAAELREQFPDAGPAPLGGIGFWPGCDSVDKGKGDVAAARAVLAAVDEDVTLIAASQVCAGYPLLAAGQPELFAAHARRVGEAVRDLDRVVINCSACLYTMRVQYPAAGVVVPEVVSLVEFLADRVDRLPRPKSRRAVYYHDPCYHARYAGVLEAPRTVLRRLAEVRELSWSGTDTECCGGGGLLPKTNPTTADAMARRRLGEVQAGGGGLVVTSCGTCSFMLRSNAPSGVEAMDLPRAIATLAEIDVEEVSTVASTGDEDDD